MGTTAIGTAVSNRTVSVPCKMGDCPGVVRGRPIRKGTSRMGDTGFASFTTTEDEIHRPFRQIEGAYGWPKYRRKQSYAALRAVVDAVRVRLSSRETPSCRCWFAASTTRNGIPAGRR
jgi:hypothetical protein